MYYNEDMEKYLNRFIKDLEKEHSRLKSWEFLYGHINCHRSRLLKKDMHERTALHLAYYLASWGMFRGGGQILYKNLEYFKDLTVILFEDIPRQYPSFYKSTFNDFEYVWFQEEFDEVVRKLKKDMEINPTDILLSKILLGVWGEVPALDRYFKHGYKTYINKLPAGFDHFRGMGLTGKSMGKLHYVSKLKKWDANFKKIKFRYNGTLLSYPHAKKIDMAFWQYGLDIS